MGLRGFSWVCFMGSPKGHGSNISELIDMTPALHKHKKKGIKRTQHNIRMSDKILRFGMYVFCWDMTYVTR